MASTEVTHENPVSFTDVEEKIMQIKTLIGELTTLVKTLEKKGAVKRPKVKKVEKPRSISKELSKFMKLKELVTSREEALRSISKYVRDKKLQDTENKREFVVDKTLSQLLKLKTGVKITFLGINKHISHHFDVSKK